MSERIPESPAKQILAAHGHFIRMGVAIDLATCDASLVPELTVGCGCRVPRSREYVTVLVDRDTAANFLETLARRRVIAATFGRPSTHESVQLKGVDARIGEASARDHALFAAYLERFSVDMALIGYPPAVSAAYVGTGAHLVTVSFAPLAAFRQTPGPDAGVRLA